MEQIALCSELIPESALRTLERHGKEVLLLPPHPALPEPVSCHADMITSYFDDTVFFDKIYSEAHPEVITQIREKTGCRVVVTDERLGEEYPADCLFNAAIGKRAALGHPSCSKALRRAIEESGRVFIPVKQGYACCSSLVAGDALITADEGIAAAAEDFFDVMTISPGNILLEPYDAGFIGGATGADAKAVYFVGDIDHHPDAAFIKDHLVDHHLDTVSLMHGRLVDVGGIKFINIE